MTSRRMTRAGALVLAALALAGCASEACTTIGCQSSVVVDVSGVRGLGSSQAGRVKVCIGAEGNCVLVLAEKGQLFVEAVLPADALPTSSSALDQPVEIRVMVMNPGQVLVDDTVSTTLTRLAPNGESCGPVCYTARLVATDRGVTALPVAATSASGTSG